MWESFGSVIRGVLFGILTFYLPGRAWSPWIFAAGATVPLRLPVLLVEVTWSAVAATWVGFLLAEAGRWSLLTFTLVMSGIAVFGWRLSQGKIRPSYGRGDVWLLAFGLAMACWLLPPLEARFASGDASGYLAAGIHVARSGSLEVTDDTVPLLDIDLRRILFPSVAADRGSPPYSRLEGGYILRSLDGAQVLPAFHHGILPWVALTISIFGPDRAEWIFGVFGVLALVAILAAARACQLPPIPSLVAASLAAAQPALFFYCRFPMPEMASAFFLWCGVALTAGSSTNARLAAIAGLALGCAALIRLENAFLVCVGLLLTALLSPQERFRHVLAPAFILSSHALLHAYFWRTHYWGNLTKFLTIETTGVRMVSMAGVAVLLFSATQWASGKIGQRARPFGRALFLALAVGLIGISQFSLRGGNEWALLWTWSGGLFLPLGLIGLFATLTFPRPAAPTLASSLVILSGVVFFLGPQATPVDFWVLRRAVVVLLPGLCLLLVLGTWNLCRSLPALGRHVSFAGIVILATWGATTKLATVVERPYYAGALLHLKTLQSSLTPGAVLLLHGSIAPLSIGPLLWAVNESPVYYVANPQDWIVSDLLSAFASKGKTIYFVSPSEQAPYTPATQGSWRPYLRYRFSLASPFLASPSEDLLWKETDLSIYRWEAPP